jgi:hypothetical protein
MSENSPGDSRGPACWTRFLYRLEPDYTQALLKVPEESERRIRKRLASLYGEQSSEAIYREIERVMRVHDAHATPEIREMERQAATRRNGLLSAT